MSDTWVCRAAASSVVSRVVPTKSGAPRVQRASFQTSQPTPQTLEEMDIVLLIERDEYASRLSMMKLHRARSLAIEGTKT